MTSNVDQKNIPSEYRLVCTPGGLPCANCYSHGAPCLNCDYYKLTATSVINWKEFQHIACHEFSTITYEEYIKIHD